MSEFRPAKAGDIACIVELARSCGLPDWGDQGWQAELDRPNAVFLVGREQRAFGLIWLAGDVAELASLCVHPNARRTGVATRLFQTLAAEATARGAREVWLEVRADNAAAIALYKRFGFNQTRTRKAYYRDGTDAVEYALTLQPRVT
jgi:ribosomal-protein-alanine N-acetyltransferase